MPKWQGEALRHVLQPVMPAGVVGVAGGKGSAKTVYNCAAAAMMAWARPGAEIALVMDTYKHLCDVHLPILKPLARSLGGTWRPGDGEARWEEGSVVRLRHLDIADDPQSGLSPLEGGNYHFIYGDELQGVDERYGLVFDERTRVWVPDRAGNDCAPGWSGCGLPRNTWWMTLIAAKGGRQFRPRTRDNEINNGPGYEAKLRAGMTEHMARSMLDGEEYVEEGGCFREYVAASEDRGGHWTDWHPADLRSTRFVLVGDLGIRWPHFGLFAQDQERGRWVCIREWAPDDATVGDVCRAMRRECIPRSQWDPKSGLLPVDQLIIDPAGRARGADGRSQADFFALPAPEGFGMRPTWEQDQSRCGVADGIDRVNMALYRKALMFSRPMMEAGLKAHHERRTLARCMVGYRWDPRRPGEPLKDNRNDHGADLVRYFTRAFLWSMGADLAASIRPPDPPQRAEGDMAWDAR